MIDYLSIKNVALIENAEINFENGLNVLTGETGAGKSILLDAIGLLLGNRFDKNLIRHGETECKVIGKFSINEYSKDNFINFCEKYSLNVNDEAYITRVQKNEGKSDIKLNGEVITLSMLKELSGFLVDSYGQNENQIIFDTANHLHILDDFAKTTSQNFYKEYIKNFEELKQINKSLKSFGGNDNERLRLIDLLKYQVDEIEQANISESEYNELQDKKRIMINLGKIVSNTMTAQNMLDDGVATSISKAKSSISQASTYDEKLSSLDSRLESVKIELDDILNEIKQYNDEIDFDESEEEQIENRLDLYTKLFRKYGNNVQEVLCKKDTMQTELTKLENADKEISDLLEQKSKMLSKMYALAGQITNHRQSNSKVLCEHIAENLTKLSIKNPKLEFKFEPYNQDENYILFDGMDKVELLFSANLGEELKPLNKIASGGEISRFMLALKSVIAENDQMPTMIFDEIDTGISGTTSEAVAKQMAIIAKNHQVIVVTHAHQIASMADTNFFIEKTEKDGRTITNVKKLTSDEKINEIARFLSGEKITDTSKEHAKQLINEQLIYKSTI